MLELTGAVFGYRAAYGPREVAGPITLSVADGSIVAIVGPSGVGKTTVLKALAGVLQPLKGEVRSIAPLRSDRVTWYEPQSPVFLPFRTVLQQTLAARELDRALKPGDVGTALEVIAELGLAGTAGVDPEQISGGMRRRVTLARGLLSERPMLLLDEPLAELDLNTRHIAERALAMRAAAVGRGVVFASHDIDSVVAIADLVLILQAPLPARASLLEIGSRFQLQTRDPERRRRDPSFASTVTWVQQHLWKQWDA